METKTRRVHHYQGNADAFGGQLIRPSEQLLPVLAPISLPTVGGYATSRHEKYRLGDIFSIGAASTSVAGTYDERNGNWTTIVTSVIEDLNVLNVLTADRIVAQISTAHPAHGYHPRVSFIGTQFEGLRLGGVELNPVLNFNLCNHSGGEPYPKHSCLHNEDFLAAAWRQNDNLAGFLDEQPEEKRGFFSWLERFPKDTPESREEVAHRGHVLCSLVEGIDSKCPGTTTGHAIHLPEFGKVFLGELLVDHTSFDLTMVRLELGSPTQGKASVAHASSGGTTSVPKTPAGHPHGGAGGTTSGGG